MSNLQENGCLVTLAIIIIALILFFLSPAPMAPLAVVVVIAHQSTTLTVSYVYNDQEQLVGKLDMPRLVTGDEAMRMAEQFADQYPDLFPGREEKKKNFAAMMERMASYG